METYAEGLTIWFIICMGVGVRQCCDILPLSVCLSVWFVLSALPSSTMSLVISSLALDLQVRTGRERKVVRELL